MQKQIHRYPHTSTVHFWVDIRKITQGYKVERTGNEKIKKICIVIIALCICLSVFILARINTLKQFDQMRWNEDFKNRKYMVENLVNKYRLIGMSKEEVINLLGENQMFLSFTNQGFVEGIHYIIGMGYVEPVLLDILFNENGYVEKYGIGN